MPFPQITDDDYLQFLVTEAVALRAHTERVEAEKDQRKKEWKRKPLGSGGL